MAAHLSPEHLELAIELQRKCWTHERIAAQLGVHRTTVSRSLARHNRRALKLLEQRSASVKARQVAQLEYIVEEAVNEWHRSKLDCETVKTTEEPIGTVADGTISETTTETTLKGQTANPGYLREARGALADVRKILGLDAPPAQPKPPDDNDDYELDLSAEANPPLQGDGPSA